MLFLGRHLCLVRERVWRAHSSLKHESIIQHHIFLWDKILLKVIEAIILLTGQLLQSLLLVCF